MKQFAITFFTLLFATIALSPSLQASKTSMTEDEERVRIEAKATQLFETAQRLGETQRKLAAARARIREKFAPSIDDEPDLLWGKMLRFRSVSMPDEACLALDIIRRKHSPDFHPDAIKAAKALCRLGKEAPTAEGVMISSFEPPATSHAIFKPGDIVVARDSTPIRRVNDWRTSVGSRYSFWRLNADGTFTLHEAVLPAGQPRVGLLNTAEASE